MVKKLSSCVREYKIQSILAPLFMLMEVLMEVLMPFLMSKLIDNGIELGNMAYIIKAGLILIVICLFSLCFGFLSAHYAAIASAGFAKNLRKDMFYNVQNLSFPNIDKFSSTSIITRLTTDVSNLQKAYQIIIRVAFRAPLMLVFSLVMAFVISPTLPVIYLCIIPILAVGIYLIMKYAHPMFEVVFKTYDKLNRIIQENLRGIRVVKSYVREDHETEKFTNVSQEIYEKYSNAEKITVFNAPLMQLSVNSSLLLISWFGAKQIVEGALTTGQLTSLITYTMQIFMSLMMLSQVFIALTVSRTSAERAAEILSEESSLKNCSEPEFNVKNGDIKFEDVFFSYSKSEDNLCLKGINLNIKSGETVGILGSTGSAKSTLIQLIPRLYDVKSGSVKVGGVDVRNYDIKSLRDNVAIVLQKNNLFSGTIKDNIRWGNAAATDEEIIDACKAAQADEFIRAFPDGYDTIIEQGGSNVSGGQKQRICIATAMLKHPKILILDDSTSAVDTRTDSLIRNAFKKYSEDTTKIIITQRAAAVEYADKIVIMDNGYIDAVGTHDDLIKSNKIYREIYESQLKGGSDL